MPPIEKILLIYPPSTQSIVVPHFPSAHPLGISYLGAVLKKDYEVKLLDATVEGHRNVKNLKNGLLKYGLADKEIKKRIIDYLPNVVGITCLDSSQMPFVRKICQLAKEVNPQIITIIGGTHPSFLASKILREGSIDFIILGEGEETLQSLLKKLVNGQDFSNLDGIAFKKDGQIQVNPQTVFIENLDDLPFPARELLPMRKYSKVNTSMTIFSKSRYWAPIITSRGCSAKCTFCSSVNFWGHHYRARSPKNVLDEIELLVKEYKIKEIQFCDDNLILNKERAQEIFQGIIDRGLPIYWNTPNGIALWKLDEDLLKLMKASGCYELTLAIESGDQEVLSKIIRKPLNLAKVEPLVKSIQKLRIRTHSFFIVGFPGETKEQIRRTFSFARKLNLTSTWFFTANPLPGSKLYDICKKMGYLKEGFDFETINYGKSNYETPEFTFAELESLVERETFIFNLSALLRHPIFFIQRYIFYLTTKPRIAIKLLMNGAIAVVRIFFLKRKT